VGIALFWAGTGGAAVTTVNCAHGNLQKKIDNVDPDSTLQVEGTCKGPVHHEQVVKLVGDPNAILDSLKAGTVLTIIDGPVLLSHLTVTGGLLTGNTADGGGIYHSAGTLRRGRCTITPLPSDIVNKGAKLGALGKHGGRTETIALLSASPAINAIPSAQCAVDKDQRGVKRPQGNRCDIGAFEVKQWREAAEAALAWIAFA
jgi:hypothetical protein